MNWGKVLAWMPEIERPKAKKLAFNTKLKWTGIILLLYFVLTKVPLYGLGHNALQQFDYLSTILGAAFGSLISLGIGPIVTASIILQLLVGSGLLNIDTTTSDGKMKFQGLQKMMIIFFIIFEGAIYVLMGGLAPAQGMVVSFGYGAAALFLIVQLCLGGFMIMMMDEVVSKWGFGSGISLFIVAGVASQIFIAAFNPLKLGTAYSAGRVLQIVQTLRAGDTIATAVAISAIIATIIVFLMCVYGQAMKVEIPLSFGRVRGYGMRWPLKFMYTSVIPVILIASLLATLQLFARLLQNRGINWLGTFQGNTAVSGIAKWIDAPSIVNSLVTGSATSTMALQAIIYMIIMVAGATLFSFMWMKTANMDAGSVSKQILSSGLQIPGFRRDPRVLESVLNRYIPALTIIGGAMVGLLAAVADLSGAPARGTGILLAVMITYNLYEEIAKQHAYDMHPALRKVMSPD